LECHKVINLLVELDKKIDRYGLIRHLCNKAPQNFFDGCSATINENPIDISVNFYPRLPGGVLNYAAVGVGVGAAQFLLALVNEVKQEVCIGSNNKMIQEAFVHNTIRTLRESLREESFRARLEQEYGTANVHFLCYDASEQNPPSQFLISQDWEKHFSQVNKMYPAKNSSNEIMFKIDTIGDKQYHTIAFIDAIVILHEWRTRSTCTPAEKFQKIKPDNYTAETYESHSNAYSYFGGDHYYAQRVKVLVGAGRHGSGCSHVLNWTIINFGNRYKDSIPDLIMQFEKEPEQKCVIF
jgi:hypothetical protein